MGSAVLVALAAVGWMLWTWILPAFGLDLTEQFFRYIKIWSLFVEAG